MKSQKEKIREKQGEHGERYTKKEKKLTILEKDTNLGVTIAPKIGLIDPANNILILSKPTKPLDK